MNGKHTPGPWLTQDEGNGEWGVWTRQPHIGSLAFVYGRDINGDFPAEANARLMAAAPKMLAELEAAAAIFRAYEAMHQAKGTDEGIGKAKRNRAFAESLERTIAEAKGEAA